MTAAEEVHNSKGDELVSIEGLEFKKYQIELIEFLAKQDNRDTKTWIKETALSIVMSRFELLEDEYVHPMLKRLAMDGIHYGKFDKETKMKFT